MQDPSLSAVIKPEVRGLNAYTLKHFDADVKLDQNENPYELPLDIKREVVDRVLRRPWARYPEFVPAAVISTLSKFTGWTQEGILVGNGSNELIQASLNVSLGPGRRCAMPQPTFTLYKLMATTLQAEVMPVFLDSENLTFNVDKLIEASRRADVVVVCSPNNPTGGLLEREALIALLKNAKGLVLLDEAYHEFSGQTALPLLSEHRHLIVLRTFSKAMSMAGLRFGYMMAHPEIAREVYKSKLPYNVNIFTLAAAEIVIENRSALNRGIDALIRERDRVFAELERREAVRAFPSKANFILIRTARPARELFDGLYSHGVLVRDVSAYPLLDRCLRVSIGTPEENDRFLAALDRVLETN
ncbi:MAG: histidinol-phosphate transaminase [Acidobacteria bacterium]|nr:MAG: histidinol-phosphate transaminase [Acidobacteriota bacterium]